ncbi:MULTISPECIES: hypothetical protein [Microbacterium]|uniref:hypothetical protein n=1 Tax=Microbacterium TaxID=33882 RepID=UPI00146F0CC5|nr:MULTISPECIES: hypothetical protein [Microbacterium]
MSFHDKSLLEEWVEEFRGLGYRSASTIRVMAQDGGDGDDTGLVGFRLPGAPTEIYLQPADHDSAAWVVTFEPREDTVTLPAGTVQMLSDEMTVLAALCSFLQGKSHELTIAHSAPETRE